MHHNTIIGITELVIPIKKGIEMKINLKNGKKKKKKSKRHLKGTWFKVDI